MHPKLNEIDLEVTELEGLRVLRKDYDAQIKAAYAGSDKAARSWFERHLDKWGDVYAIYNSLNPRQGNAEIGMAAMPSRHMEWVTITLPPGRTFLDLKAWCRQRNERLPRLFVAVRRLPDDTVQMFSSTDRIVIGSPGGRKPSTDSLRAKLAAIPEGETAFIDGYSRPTVQSTISAYRDELPHHRLMGMSNPKQAEVRHFRPSEFERPELGKKHGLGPMRAGDVLTMPAGTNVQTIRVMASKLNKASPDLRWSVKETSEGVIVRCAAVEPTP